MKRKTVGLIIAVVLLINGSLMLYFAVQGRKGKKVLAAPSLICPECKQALKYDGADCAYCAYKKRIEGTRGTDLSAKPGMSAVAKLGISGGVLSVLLAFLYWPQIRPLLRRVKPVPLFVIRCGKCKRKLKYLATCAGRDGLCPGCGVKFTFPQMTPAGLPRSTTIKTSTTSGPTIPIADPPIHVPTVQDPTVQDPTSQPQQPL